AVLCGTGVPAGGGAGPNSGFWLGGRSGTDPRSPRYPRLPVLACAGYEPGSAQPRVERVSEPVADQVEGQDGAEDGEPREGGQIGVAEDVVAGGAQHAAPLRRGRLDPQAQEAEGRRQQDRRAQLEAGLDDDWRQGVGDDVPEKGGG